MTNKPSVLQRAKAAIKFYRQGWRGVMATETKKFPYSWPTWRTGNPEWQITDYQNYAQEAYAENAIVYGAMRYWYDAVRCVPLRAYKGSLEEPKLLPMSHPLAQLCLRPNRWQGWPEFQGLAQIYLKLAGDSYIYVDRLPGQEIPQALYTLRPDRVFIVPTNNPKDPIGYIYMPEGKGIQDGVPYLAKNIIHCKNPNPLDALDGLGYGLSDISAGARSIDVDNAVTRYLKMFFDQGAMPPGMLTFDMPMTNESVAEARRRWMEIYGGSANWSDIAVLDQGGKYQRLGLSFSELGMAELDGRNWTAASTVLGVPLTLIVSRPELVSSTYNNKDSDRRMFWQDKVYPEMGGWEREYQYYLSTEKGEFVKFDFSKVPALTLTPQEFTTMAQQALSAGAITVNEYRAKINQNQADDGDVYLIPSSVVVTPYKTKQELNDALAGETAAALPASTTGEAGPVNLDSTIGLNGAQISSIMEVLSQVQSGVMAELVAVELLVSVGIAQDRAVRIVAATLDKKPVEADVSAKPKPIPPSLSTTPTPATTSGNEEMPQAVDEAQQAGAKRFDFIGALRDAKLMTMERKDAFWLKSDELAASYDEEFGAAAVKALEANKRDLLALLNKGKSKAASYDWAKYEAAVKAYLLGAGSAEVWKSIFETQQTDLMTAKVKQLNAEFNKAYPSAELLSQQWFDSYQIQFAQPINDTTNETVKRMIQQATDEGWSVLTMQGHLETMFKQWMTGTLTPDEFAWYNDRMPVYRRENIARTETIKASNVVSNALYEAWGSKGREWLATRDSRTRDTHAAADGQVRAFGKKFDVGGYAMEYPGDMNAPAALICNCRCSLIPIID